MKNKKEKTMKGETMNSPKIKIEYLLGGWNPQVWTGTLKEAMQIALSEIHEHAGGSSPAYIFTEKIFDGIEK